MKKFLTMGVLALTLGALVTHDASAWVNTKFGVGLNWSCQSGGNSLLWGAFKNGQPPAPDGGCPQVVPAPGPVGPFGYLQPADQGFQGAAQAGVQGQTQSYGRPYYPYQTVNYQYPNYYNYYYGYGR